MSIKNSLKNILYFFCVCIYIVCAICVVGYAVKNHIIAYAICGMILSIMATPFIIKCIKKLF